MTCDSKVKWPKGLKVFRCVACLTVNDLEPTSQWKGEQSVQVDGQEQSENPGQPPRGM